MKIRLIYLFTILIIPIVVSSQTINFSDINFKNRLLLADINSPIAFDINDNKIKIDINSNNEIEINEAMLVYTLDVSNSNINNLNGLQFFSNVYNLNCSYNNITNFNFTLLPNLLYFNGSYNLITSLSLNNNNTIDTIELNYNNLNTLSVTNCNNLWALRCSNNNLSSINIQNLPTLFDLNFSNNLLSTVSLSNFTDLTYLYLNNNQLNNLIINNCPNSKWLFCSNNLLTTLDLSNLSLLQKVYCFDNNLTSINLTSCTSLTQLFSSNNNLTSLDCSSCSSLDVVDCQNNQLTYLNVKNGIHETSYGICGNPNLNHVCVDNTSAEINHMAIQLGNTMCNYSNVNIDTNCLLNNSNFTFTKDFELFPNPVQNMLTISKNSDSLIKSINIYNNIGQLVQTQLKDENENIFKLDVSSLRQGIYYVIIATDKGTFSEKFLKN